MSDAISNILSTCIYRTPGRVGFARGRKLLLKITNLDNRSLPSESNSEKTVTSKVEVIGWLKRSLDAVRDAHLAAKPSDLERKVHILDRDATVDGMYLRIIVHANEHMGQLVAYARMTGVVPPWSKN